jgi:hypothetical protein
VKWAAAPPNNAITEIDIVLEQFKDSCAIAGADGVYQRFNFLLRRLRRV